MNGTHGKPKSESARSVNRLIGIKQKCSKCETIKELIEFPKHSGGFSSVCILCKKERIRKYLDNTKSVKSVKNKEWRSKNKEYESIKKKEYYILHKDEKLIYCKAWASNNRDKVRELGRNRNKKRRSTAEGRLSTNMATAMWRSLRENKKRAHWESLVGYTIKELKQYLEIQFKDGMSWDNYGTFWHLDHKVPVTAFNYELASDIDFKKCWAITNFQPLEKIENIKKSNNLVKPFQPSLLIG